MNIDDIKEQYEVNEQGIITSPGKFEGEAAHAVFFWDAALNGFADGYGDDGACWFDIDQDDVVKFPALQGVKRLSIDTDNSGFVYLAEWRK